MVGGNAGLGYEPVRKNLPGLDITPQTTFWAGISVIPEFLQKLFTGEDYNETDDVIKLAPATIPQENTIAEDPGYIEPAMFNYTEEQCYDRYGVREGQEIIDPILMHMVRELWRLYGLNGSDDLRVSFPTPIEMAWYFSEEADADYLKALVPAFVEKVTEASYTVFVCHSGYRGGGHYICVAIDMIKNNIHVLDSLAPGGPSGYAKIFLRRFRKFWNQAFPGSRPTYLYPRSEPQRDVASCGFYALHNAHRFVHALCANFDDPAHGFDAVARNPVTNSVLPRLTPKLIQSWRLKLARAYFENVRQQKLREAFTRIEDLRACPGLSPNHWGKIFTHQKLLMTIPEREARQYGPSKEPGAPLLRIRGNRAPYDKTMVYFEKFNENTVFAQLLKDWKKDEVAGIIIRLSKSKSEKSTKQAVYKAVGWDQTVLLSTMPDGETCDWSRPHASDPVSFYKATPNAKEQDIVKTCWKEVQKIKKIRPDLQGEDLRLHSKYIAGMLSNHNPKLIIQPKRDGTTWAKANWQKGEARDDLNSVKINADKPSSYRGGTLRLPEYCFIELIESVPLPADLLDKYYTDRAHKNKDKDKDKENDKEGGGGEWNSMGKRKSNTRHAMYIWVQKWPYVGFADPTSNLDLRGAIPVQNIEIWNWWGLDGLLTTDFEKEMSKDAFAEVNGPYIQDIPPNIPRGGTLWPEAPGPRFYNSNFFTLIESDNEPQFTKKTTTNTGLSLRSNPVGWVHKKRPKDVTRTKQMVKSQPTTIPKLPSHSEAYLNLSFPALQPSDPNLSQSIKNMKHVYLAYLLFNMSGPAVLKQGGSLEALVDPQKGHRHHHHRPEQILLDHRWRVRYYTVLQPERFPWRSKEEKNVQNMIRGCKRLCRNRQTAGQLEEGIEWGKFCELLKLGQKATELWNSPPLEGRGTMRCLSGSCEQLRKDSIKFDKEPPSALDHALPAYWTLYDQYQRWRYGAPECPTDCPLRDWGCPKDCNEVHNNPLGIRDDEMKAFVDTKNLGVSEEQAGSVFKVLEDRFPNRWEGAPPYFWSPVKPEGGFWDPKDNTNKTLDARVTACENRLRDWEILTDDQRLAILRSEEIYYHDIHEVVNGLDWPTRSQAAENRGKEVIERMKTNPEYTVPLLPRDASFNYMKRKLDETTAYIDETEKVWTENETFYISKRIRYKDAKFSQLKEYW